MEHPGRPPQLQLRLPVTCLCTRFCVRGRTTRSTAASSCAGWRPSRSVPGKWMLIFTSKMSFSSLFVISGFYEDVYRVLISFKAGLSALVSKIFLSPTQAKWFMQRIRTWLHKVTQLGWDCFVFSIYQARSILTWSLMQVLPSTDSVQAGLPEQGLMEISADAGM